MRSLYTQFCAGLLFPLHERLKGHDSVAVRRELEASQWYSSELLRGLQIKRLKDLLHHADSNVPYYRQIFAELGFAPDSVRSLDDLGRLPFLTKTAIRANTDALKSGMATNLTRLNTGGSSGEPLIFFVGKERTSHDVAAKWRATRWWDVDIGDREIVVWGSPIELSTQDRIKSVRDQLMRTRLLPAFEMSAAKLDGFIATMRSVRPRMLFGYPSALSHIARHAEATGKRLNDVGIQVAFVTSEQLYDDQRAQIEKTFGCRVANGYGGRDAGFIAHQCPEGEMHITAEDIIVEIIDTEGKVLPPGSSGEIVVTHLASRDFPFIRYRTGDIGVVSTRQCRCGRGLPVLQEIQGRTTDFVVAQDGTIMHGLALIYVLRDLPGVQAFKIVQESLDHTRIMLTPNDGVDVTALSGKIVEGLRARLGYDTKITVDIVDQIPAEKSGKYRYVQSNVVAANSIG